VRVLLLAGSAEGAELARLLHDRGVPTVTSLAGRTRAPAELPGEVREGGFGGPMGLARTLNRGGFTALVDATHPFSARMPHHATSGAAIAGVPRLRLLRPPWTPGPGDRWHDAGDHDAAARLLPAVGARRVLLTVGRQDLAPFAALDGMDLVVRSIEPVPPPEGGRWGQVVTARPPFTVESETDLLRTHAIDTLVTRNSGAAATAAKLTAARALGVRVVVIRRPQPPAGPLVEDAAAALRWVETVVKGPGRRDLH